VGENEESELIRSAKPLLLDSLNLDDDSILDDHADFTETDAFYGCPHMIQVQVAGGRGVVGSSIIESGKSLFRHTSVTPVRCINGKSATIHANRCPRSRSHPQRATHSSNPKIVRQV
jgi:hypothetical protein